MKENVHPNLDYSNDLHFINLVPATIEKAILNIPYTWFNWNDNEILMNVYEGRVGYIDQSLRLSFWDEYNKCFLKKIKMKSVNIYSGIISQSGFDRTVLGNPGRVLYMITEPAYDKKRLELTYHLFLTKMLELAASTDPKDKPLQLKGFHLIDQRLHGGYIQKIEQTSKNLNVNVDATPQREPETLEDIDTRLAELDKQLSEPARLPSMKTHLPVDAVLREAGRVVDADFINLKNDRDNSHRE